MTVKIFYNISGLTQKKELKHLALKAES